MIAFIGTARRRTAKSMCLTKARSKSCSQKPANSSHGLRLAVQSRSMNRLSCNPFNRQTDRAEVAEDPEVRKFGLAPVIDSKTEILILGTLPSDVSLAKGQYYANPNNDFWKLMGAVLNRHLEI